MSTNIEQIKAMLERAGKTNILQKQEVDFDKEYLQLQQQAKLDEEMTIFFSKNPIPCKLILTDWLLLKNTAIHFYEFGRNAKDRELPEIGLDKFIERIKTFQDKYKHPEIVSIKGAMAFMARMFYQYPNVARRWYEQLPKATMD